MLLWISNNKALFECHKGFNKSLCFERGVIFNNPLDLVDSNLRLASGVLLVCFESFLMIHPTVIPKALSHKTNSFVNHSYYSCLWCVCVCVCVCWGSDRPNVRDHELVERLQLPYVEALRSYIRIKRPNVSMIYLRCQT